MRRALKFEVPEPVIGSPSQVPLRSSSTTAWLSTSITASGIANSLARMLEARSRSMALGSLPGCIEGAGGDQRDGAIPTVTS